MAERLTRRVAEQRAISGLARLALTADFDDLLDAAVHAITEPVVVDFVAILRADPTNDDLLMCTHVSPLVGATERVPGNERSHAGYAMSRNATVVTSDFHGETRFGTERSRRAGIRSGIAVPIPAPGRPWGVVTAHTREVREYTDDDIAFLEMVAGILSASLRRLDIEQQLRHQALHDPLTGLPNRVLVNDRIGQALRRTGRGGPMTAVVLIDLDDFKTVNDSLGHSAGDDLLMALAPRLQEVMRPTDTVGRLGGDEFVVVCENLDSPLEAAAIAKRIAGTWRDPVPVADQRIHISGSMGITLSTGPDTDVAEMLREADIAMYRAKRRGPNSFELFDEGMRHAASHRLTMATDLRDAIEHGKLRLAYQPIVDLTSGRIVALEALTRWDHPGRGQVPPSEFIQIAEETGLILPLGEWSLRSA
ncbi:MAG: putative bifunctional diguanylate cyclase/phosphodiesterase, partial [Acidimicrobiales bacterium]